MLQRALSGNGGGGSDSDNMKELSLIDGTSSNVAVQNINGTTNEVVFPSGSYIWQGQYLKNDFSSSPRKITAVANCRAISIDEYGNCMTKDYSSGDTILSWNMGNMGNVNRVIGAIVLSDHHSTPSSGNANAIKQGPSRESLTVNVANADYIFTEVWFGAGTANYRLVNEIAYDLNNESGNRSIPWSSGDDHYTTTLTFNGDNTVTIADYPTSSIFATVIKVLDE